MKMRFLAAAFFVLCGAAGAAPVGDPTILSCDGITTNSGRNAPKDSVEIPQRHQSATFTVGANKLTSQSLVLSGETLSLCKETPTEYVYSTNCVAPPRAFIGDWLAMKDSATANQLMSQKYGEYSVMLETVRIDRVNLTVSDEFISPQLSAEFKKMARGAPLLPGDISTRFFVLTTEFRGQCKIAKAQF